MKSYYDYSLNIIYLFYATSCYEVVVTIIRYQTKDTRGQRVIEVYYTATKHSTESTESFV